MAKRSARLGRALLVLPALAACDQLWANTGVQIPLSQYQAGSEQATLVNNGNFANPGAEDPPTSGLYPNPDGWSNRTGDVYAKAPAFSHASFNPVLGQYSVVARNPNAPGNPPSARNGYTQNYTNPLTTDAVYVLSAYIWNAGTGDPVGGTGDLASLKVQDPNETTFNNISLTLDGTGSSDPQASGRFMYILFDEARVRNWTGGVQVLIEAENGAAGTGLPSEWAQFDNIAITRADQFSVQRWTGASGGSWTTGGNWLNGAPNVESAVATLGGDVAVPTTINIDANVTVGVLNFNNAAPYTLSGANTITLDVSEDGFHQFQGIPEINVLAGNHTISAPLVFNSVLDAGHDPVAQPLRGAFNVAAGSTLTISNLTATLYNLLKRGDGIAVVDKLRANSMAVKAGTFRVAPNGVASGTSTLDSITVEAGAKFDLTDNKLIITTPDSTGTWNGSAYTGVAGLVDGGRGNAGNALWDGSGIVTSDTRAINNGDLVSIGVAKVSNVRAVGDTETTSFSGQTVLGSDTIAMATWGGDANLDGKINIDDYGRIDGNVGQSGTVFGWDKGDFNYDGKINIDDYGIIDGNINRQGTPFSTGGSVEGVAAVPEPAGVVLVVGAAALIRRRRQ